VATVPFTDWLPFVLPHAVGVPDLLATKSIQSACIDFCNQTNWWQGTLGPITLSTANVPYTFVPPTGATVAQIMSAIYKGIPLAHTNIDELTNKVLNWRDHTGDPRAVFQEQPGIASLYPAPAVGGSYDVTFRVSYAPLRASTTIDQQVFEAFQDEIAAGALGILFAMPQKPWTDMDMAKAYSAAFTNAKVLGAIQASRSYGRQGQQIQMRAF